MRVAVFGAGGVGGYFGGRLAQAGIPVSFIARGGHLRALERDGLRVESVAGDFTIDPVVVADDAATIGEVDCVLMSVKSWQLPEASALTPLVGPNTAVVSLLNGVEAPAQIADLVGKSHVIPGTARIFSEIAAPGVIRHSGGASSLAFAEWDNEPSERVEALRSALRLAGVSVEVPEDIHKTVWSKFLFVVPLGSIGAVSRAPVGVTRSIRETRELLEAGMLEIQAVAHASGIELPRGIVRETMAYLDELPAAGTSSLQRDIEAGVRSELDSWTGAVVRLGAKVDVSVPVHEFAYRCLLPRERRARGEIEFV